MDESQPEAADINSRVVNYSFADMLETSADQHLLLINDDTRRSMIRTSR